MFSGWHSCSEYFIQGIKHFGTVTHVLCSFEEVHMHADAQALSRCGARVKRVDSKQISTPERSEQIRQGRSPIITCENLWGLQRQRNPRLCDLWSRQQQWWLDLWASVTYWCTCWSSEWIPECTLDTQKLSVRRIHPCQLLYLYDHLGLERTLVWYSNDPSHFQQFSTYSNQQSKM